MPSNNIIDIVKSNQDEKGMLKRALERIIQLYTDKSHFIFELLQNAEDAGATKIKFMQYEDRLIVLHDGHPFSVQNLQGLCDIGKSDKIDDLNKIGEFGVGFKSVFGICERVQLFSHPSQKEIESGYQRFSVEIVDFVHPVKFEDREIANGYTTMFIFPYAVGKPFSGFDDVDSLNRKISNRLQNLGITTLLFMKTLKEIDYSIDLPELKTSGIYMLDKKQLSKHCALVSAIGETNGSDEDKVSYLLFSKAIKNIQIGRTIDLAFNVNVEKNGDYTFYPSEHPYISVYFPTETESKLKFIVQGPYRTTPNRSSVPADDEDNILLASQTAEFLRECIIELRKSGKLNYTFFNVLPIEENLGVSPLFKCVFDKTKDVLANDDIYLCNDKSYTTALCAKIARNKELTDLFADELLSDLYNKECHWLPTNLTETNKTWRSLYFYLANEIKIKVIRPEDLRDPFNANQQFLKKQTNEWLVKLYSMFSSVANAFAKQPGANNMLTCNFIKTTTGDFVAPFRKSSEMGNSGSYLSRERKYEKAAYIPNLFLQSASGNEIKGINIVNQEIFEQCTNFFTEILALEQPNEYEFFLKDFKERYSYGVEITDEQHISDIKQLLKYLQNQDYKDEINGLIKRYLTLRCHKDGIVVYKKPSDKEKIYFSLSAFGGSIELYFKNIISVYYIDFDFYEKNDIDRFALLALGVSEDISIKKDVIRGTVLGERINKQIEWNTSGDFRWELSLEKLTNVLDYIDKNPTEPDSMAKSNFILKFLIDNEAKLKGFVNMGFNEHSIPQAYSYILQYLRISSIDYSDEERARFEHYYFGKKWSGKWLFTDSGDLVAQKDISKRELNKSLYGDYVVNSSVYDYLGFKKNEEDLMEDAEKEYDKLPNDKKEQYFEIAIRRVFGDTFTNTGTSVRDFIESLGSSMINVGDPTKTAPIQEHYEFPISKVKNWDSLRKHVAEVLCFASPTHYEYKIRKTRVSKPQDEIRAYLTNMYKVEGAYKYACQICHNPYANVEMCQIQNKPEIELDAMNLCLCPNCASIFQKIRFNDDSINKFIDEILSKSDADIASSNPVEISLKDLTVWFTQTHIAEIKELFTMMKDFSMESDAPKTSDTPQVATGKVSLKSSGLEAYKEYTGNTVFVKTENAHAKVKSCDGKYLTIEFLEGARKGKTVNYLLETVISKNLVDFEPI